MTPKEFLVLLLLSILVIFGIMFLIIVPIVMFIIFGDHQLARDIDKKIKQMAYRDAILRDMDTKEETK